MKHASIFSYHNWWLIHPDSQTTAGVWLAQPPYLKFAITVDSAALGRNLLSALAQSQHNIPHPTVWDKNDPVLELAGAKSWRAFAKDATYFDVTCDDGRVTIARWDYRAKDAAFIPNQEPPTQVASDSSVEQIGEAIKEAYQGHSGDEH